jgi:hypothetical protein
MVGAKAAGERLKMDYVEEALCATEFEGPASDAESTWLSQELRRRSTPHEPGTPTMQTCLGNRESAIICKIEIAEDRLVADKISTKRSEVAGVTRVSKK